MSQPIRVLLADHNPNLRMGLRTIVEQAPDITIVGEAEEGKGALEQIETLQPDVVVLDCQLPEVSGAEVAGAIQTSGLATRVLALGLTVTREEILPMIQAGALGYVLRDEAPEMIVTALYAVARGAGCFGPAVAAQMATWMGGVRPTAAGLTQKQMAVLRLIALGQSNKEIASELGMKRRTVEQHVSNILAKLGLESRTQAAMWAKEHELDKG